jgi:hypothetical protein
MAGCTSCSASFETFENAPTPDACQKPLAQQACTYTAQGEVVCGGTVDPKVQQQMQFPSREQFMMNATRQPVVEGFRGAANKR